MKELAENTSNKSKICVNSWRMIKMQQCKRNETSRDKGTPVFKLIFIQSRLGMPMPGLFSMELGKSSFFDFYPASEGNCWTLRSCLVLSSVHVLPLDVIKPRISTLRITDSLSSP